MKRTILFLCTGNSCRSQMAEGLMNKLSGDHFEAFSAGSRPAGYVHTKAIDTMEAMGVDISHNTSKSIDTFSGQLFNFVITVCDNAKEECPIFPGEPVTAHWGFEDPAKVDGDDEHISNEFRRIAVEIERRIRLFLALPEDKLSELDYLQAVRDIGTT
jgi:thioredoxin type arsenate reductase